ncbi:T9SS type B sorting domain-containing protein [Flavobacterium sp.]|uniref:Ig-like domain-containing protein n=1 Tax=Flavobacterium sp. TaxID=239 RepID=UPI00261905A0|nr:T9SS type B sorting domain-containing protein [Flavobacterium sp.]MDG2432152.1 T9SS type B sorting domain-containing protein [Flavobacterium sp.]
MKKFGLLFFFALLSLTYSSTGFASNTEKTKPKLKKIKKSTIAAIIPPTITVTGNQIYCPGIQQKIVETVIITNDPLEPTTKSVTIQIASGYVIAQDLLSLIGSHPNITSSWSSLEGKLTLSNPTGIPYSDFEAAIKDVVYSSSSLSPTGNRAFSINLGLGNVSYLPSNGHFYEYVPALGISWIDARNAASARNYYGLQGYLATLTAADEAQLAGTQAPGAGWIGGSDSEIEGTWKWVTGPEGLANGGTGITFWIGQANGTTTASFNFAFWNNGEPNQSNGTNEDYAHITAPGVGIPGSWNDLILTGDPSGNYQPKGYIVEYGGLPGEAPLQTSASTKMTMINIVGSTGSSRCGPASSTLQAVANGGTVQWYDSPTNGTLFATGTSFTTPILNTTTTFYAATNANGCTTGARTPVIATISPIPTITATVPAQRCDSGSIQLSATASAGTINWYAASTGGTPLASGNTFTTPTLSNSTTYYIDATNNGCVSSSRTAITATVTATPTITTTTPATKCGSGSVTLQATASVGTVSWYSSPTGGTALANGTSFTTPTLTSTTTYYAEGNNANCTTATRTAVSATIIPTPLITTTTPAAQCQAGPVTLMATASVGTINWYTTATGGTAIATGNTFTTPSLSSTTTYYVDATANNCTTLARTAVTATIDSIPTIVSTSPSSSCGPGTATITATSSVGIINWYDAPNNGRLLATGNSFTSPFLNQTTTYYAEAVNNSCTSASRTVVEVRIFPLPPTTSEEVVKCQQDNSLLLDAGLPNLSYLWSTGETTQKITVSAIGTYTVTITNSDNCTSEKTIVVTEHEVPVISSIDVNDSTVTINLSQSQDYYEFSINGIDYQKANIFYNVPGGTQTAYVREVNLCSSASETFIAIVVPKYFTPNNDTYNDYWQVDGLLEFPTAKVSIYNRYGKLIGILTPKNPKWNGTFNGSPLPADDYWYVLKIDDSGLEKKGHFSLKR